MGLFLKVGWHVRVILRLSYPPGLEVPSIYLCAILLYVNPWPTLLNVIQLNIRTAGQKSFCVNAKFSLSCK